MRGSRRPSSQQTNKPASAGNALREALAKKAAGDDTRAQDEEARRQEAVRESLSIWFNGVAAKLPQKIDNITAELTLGRSPSTDLSYSAADDGILLRSVTGAMIETLPGFWALDQTCRDLDIQCSVSLGKYGYGRKSTAGQEYLHVNIDAAKPYQPVTVEKPAPHGPGRFR